MVRKFTKTTNSTMGMTTRNDERVCGFMSCQRSKLPQRVQHIQHILLEKTAQQGPTVRSFDSHTPAITQRSFALNRGNREDHEQSPYEFDTESLDHSSLGFG